MVFGAVGDGGREWIVDLRDLKHLLMHLLESIDSFFELKVVIWQFGLCILSLARRNIAGIIGC
jgi:hypothetical protein